MKKTILTIFTTFLIITSCLNVVTANMNENPVTNTTNTETGANNKITENEAKEEKNETDRIGESVSAASEGYQNITFSDGYQGYCANKHLNDAEIGDNFTVQDTYQLKNPNYNESVGNYLKILFVDHYDYVINDKLAATLTIWEFTDNLFKTEYYRDIIPEILKAAEEGRVIPDHGEVKKINNTTEAIFDFEYLVSSNEEIQNFFGFKITYRDIINEITNSTDSLENFTINNIPNEDDAENKTEQTENTQNNTNKTTENNTQQTENTQNNPNKTTENNTEILITGKQENQSTNTNSVTPQQNYETNENNTSDSQEKLQKLNKYVTGNEIAIISMTILILFSGLIDKYKRD